MIQPPRGALLDRRGETSGDSEATNDLQTRDPSGGHKETRDSAKSLAKDQWRRRSPSVGGPRSPGAGRSSSSSRRPRRRSPPRRSRGSPVGRVENGPARRLRHRSSSSRTRSREYRGDQPAARRPTPRNGGGRQCPSQGKSPGSSGQWFPNSQAGCGEQPGIGRRKTHRGRGKGWDTLEALLGELAPIQA